MSCYTHSSFVSLQLSKRRNVQQTGGDDDFALDLSAGGAMNSEVSSTTGAGSICSVITPELIEALYSDSMEVMLQATERFRKLLSKGLYCILCFRLLMLKVVILWGLSTGSRIDYQTFSSLNEIGRI